MGARGAGDRAADGAPSQTRREAGDRQSGRRGTQPDEASLPRVEAPPPVAGAAKPRRNERMRARSICSYARRAGEPEPGQAESGRSAPLRGCEICCIISV